MSGIIGKKGIAAAAEVFKPKQASGVSGKEFKEVLEGLKGKGDPFLEIQKMSHDLLTKKDPSAQELILYQIKAQQFGLRVELVSKVAESAGNTFKKLQNG
jgi:hypothetical protein